MLVVFTCRSCHATKAYIDIHSKWAREKACIEVEREFARLTLQVEEELVDWTNKTCSVAIANCKSEEELAKCFTDLSLELPMKVDALVIEKLEMFVKYCDKHPASEIIVQWKEEKCESFKLCDQALQRQMEKLKARNYKRSTCTCSKYPWKRCIRRTTSVHV